jgi:hypothetical protein
VDRRVGDRIPLLGVGQTRGHWVWPLVCPGSPRLSGLMTVITYRDQSTLVQVFASDDPAPDATRREVDRAVWTAMLSDLGDRLVARASPALGLLAPIDARVARTPAEMGPEVAERRLLVGWRTWFGPPYVAAFGREWLMRLPGESEVMPDGIVAHRLPVTASALHASPRAAYAFVRVYARARGVTLAWPPT